MSKQHHIKVIVNNDTVSIPLEKIFQLPQKTSFKVIFFDWHRSLLLVEANGTEDTTYRLVQIEEDEHKEFFESGSSPNMVGKNFFMERVLKSNPEITEADYISSLPKAISSDEILEVTAKVCSIRYKVVLTKA